VAGLARADAAVEANQKARLAEIEEFLAKWEAEFPADAELARRIRRARGLVRRARSSPGDLQFEYELDIPVAVDAAYERRIELQAAALPATLFDRAFGEPLDRAKAGEPHFTGLAAIVVRDRRRRALRQGAASACLALDRTRLLVACRRGRSGRPGRAVRVRTGGGGARAPDPAGDEPPDLTRRPAVPGLSHWSGRAA
jgi:hypothetical protein